MKTLSTYALSSFVGHAWADQRHYGWCGWYWGNQEGSVNPDAQEGRTFKPLPAKSTQRRFSRWLHNAGHPTHFRWSPIQSVVQLV